MFTLHTFNYLCLIKEKCNLLYAYSAFNGEKRLSSLTLSQLIIFHIFIGNNLIEALTKLYNDYYSEIGIISVSFKFQSSLIDVTHFFNQLIRQYDMSKCVRFPTMLYVRPAKAQTSLRIRAV